MEHTGLSSTTIAILRNCQLTIGADFVRCATRGLVKESREQNSAVCAAVRECNEDGVTVSWHPDLGDYVQVRRGTRTFALICRLKS